MEFSEIKSVVEEKAPEGKVAKVDVEGPKVILYTNDIVYFVENNQKVRELATTLKKRIIVRASPECLMETEKSKGVIEEVIPKEANISDIEFDPFFAEVRIEAEKLGLVIGKHGSTLDEIIRKTGWTPKLLRKPPIQSDMVRAVRKTLSDSSEDRQKILKAVGRKIYRKPDAECDWIRVTFLGGASQVGRSAVLLQTPESNVLLDCGIDVAGQDQDRYPDFRAAQLAISDLDAVVISHAHLDHCGFLPYLYKYGYEGPVYCTEPTRDLMALLQLDAVEIGSKEDKELPFTSKEVKTMLKHTVTLDYEEVADITPDIHLTLYNAGHILGSSICHLHLGEGLHNLVYTGDIKFGDTRLLEAATFEFPRAETLIIESTYGGRYDQQPPRQDAERLLYEIIQNTVQKKGKLLIPVFSVGRSQEVMMVLESFYGRNEINVPVYLDGMIWEATAIHTSYPEYLKKNVKHRVFNGFNPFLVDAFKKVEHKERLDIINSGEPCIVLSTSGMMTGGPVLEYFKHLAEDANNSLAFVGYQAEGSLGRRLQNGLSQVTVDDDGRTKMLNVRMNVQTIDGFSGHADRKQLLGYAKKIHPKPKRALIVHGEPNKSENLSHTFRDMFRLDSTVPRNLDSIRLV
ncbi:MAG: beta-CASP ribonuclease aCPSF1 [Candidatus Altiarchaeales archaeon]|nr:beta-CASP ribonuclease aCPSF1 [Candidatus Altiarchaeales archaeon]